MRYGRTAFFLAATLLAPPAVPAQQRAYSPVTPPAAFSASAAGPERPGARPASDQPPLPEVTVRPTLRQIDWKKLIYGLSCASLWATAAADARTTRTAIRHGYGTEANPFLRNADGSANLKRKFALVAAVQGASVAVYALHHPWWATAIDSAASLVQGLAAGHNAHLGPTTSAGGSYVGSEADRGALARGAAGGARPAQRPEAVRLRPHR